MSIITWLHAEDCYPPHGLDMTAPRNDAGPSKRARAMMKTMVRQ